MATNRWGLPPVFFYTDPDTGGSSYVNKAQLYSDLYPGDGFAPQPTDASGKPLLDWTLVYISSTAVNRVGSDPVFPILPAFTSYEQTISSLPPADRNGMYATLKGYGIDIRPITGDWMFRDLLDYLAGELGVPIVWNRPDGTPKYPLL